jgi:hypothetical protein
LATSTLSHALADCLESIREGESLEACLDKHPAHRENLRPLLQLARALERHQADPAPSPRFVIKLKSKLSQEPIKNRKGGDTDRKKN